MNIQLHNNETKEKHFYVRCNVCNQVLEDWVGSTPYCGSIAYECDENGKVLNENVQIYGFVTKPQ